MQVGEGVAVLQSDGGRELEELLLGLGAELHHVDGDAVDGDAVGCDPRGGQSGLALALDGRRGLAGRRALGVAVLGGGARRAATAAWGGLARLGCAG